MVHAHVDQEFIITNMYQYFKNEYKYHISIAINELESLW
jgi:hypothetical protein